jgi:hypothetical protein
MQLLGLVLVLVNIGAILGPVAGVAIIYRDNIAGLVIPPEVTQLVNETASAATQIQLPQLLNYTYDQNAKTVTVVFNFTNPLSLNVTVNSLAADVVCNEHNVLLGHVGIASPVELKMNVTAYLTVIFAWTSEAQNHFIADHASQSSIGVSLRDIVVDIGGITVEAPTSYNIGNIPIPQV